MRTLGTRSFCCKNVYVLVPKFWQLCLPYLGRTVTIPLFYTQPRLVWRVKPKGGEKSEEAERERNAEHRGWQDLSLPRYKPEVVLVLHESQVQLGLAFYSVPRRPVEREELLL